MTVFVLLAASAGVAVRFSAALTREMAGGVVALLLAANALLLWAAFRNNSIRRQRALLAEFTAENRE